MNDEPDKLQLYSHRVWTVHGHLDFYWNFSDNWVGTWDVNMFDDLQTRLVDDF